MRGKLKKEEMETIISWCDNDRDKIFIHNTQMPMMRKLMKNPFFEVESYHNDIGCEPHGVDGYLPRSLLTIRNKRRKLPIEQAKLQIERLRQANMLRRELTS